MKIMYVVQEGDCLKKIADKFNITVQDLAIYNNITNVDTIKCGDFLHIPSKGDVSK